jgi:hypothetical protein
VRAFLFLEIDKMKVYVVEEIETGNRIRVYGKGTRVYVSKSAAIAKVKHSVTRQVVEYDLVPTGVTFAKENV